MTYLFSKSSLLANSLVSTVAIFLRLPETGNSVPSDAPIFSRYRNWKVSAIMKVLYTLSAWAGQTGRKGLTGRNADEMEVGRKRVTGESVGRSVLGSKAGGTEGDLVVMQ